jgi:hypothetical protein
MLGWLPAVLNLLGMGGGGAVEVERPHYALCLDGADYRRVVMVGRRKADECDD